NAETNTETRVDPFECVEIGRRPVGEFEDQVVGVKTVQERNQGLPLSFLNGLSAVITETKMDGLLDAYSIQNAIDCFGGERTVGRVARDVSFIDLHACAIQFAHLRG